MIVVTILLERWLFKHEWQNLLATLIAIHLKCMPPTHANQVFISIGSKL